MANGFAQIDAWIARLRMLAGPRVGERIAREAAPAVGAAVKKTAAAGKTPEGEAWKPKQDGGRPLANAAAAISSSSAGAHVVVTLSGPTVFHHRGLGGKPVRQVIPDSGTVPDGVRKAVLEAAKRVFREIVGGRR